VEAASEDKVKLTDETQSTYLETMLAEAVKLLVQAENEVKIKQQKVAELQKRLKEVKLKEKEAKEARNPKKLAEADKAQEEISKTPEKSAEDELKRKAEIRRKWRILGMKVRVGVTANIVRRRKMNDADSFLDKETDTVTKEDNLDLEGKCEQKKTVKSKWRRGGILVGAVQGRDSAF